MKKELTILNLIIFSLIFIFHCSSTSEDIEMLQDLIVAAVNQARQKAQEIQNEQMSQLTGGLNIPGLNLPF